MDATGARKAMDFCGASALRCLGPRGERRIRVNQGGEDLDPVELCPMWVKESSRRERKGSGIGGRGFEAVNLEVGLVMNIKEGAFASS